MNTVNFNDTNYQIEGVVAQNGAILITSLPGPELVILHNLLNSNMGIGKSVKKFSDKRTAVKRVAAKLVEYNDYDETKEDHTKQVKKTRKRRGMHFTFRPEDSIHTCKGSIRSKSKDTRTLRQRAIALLTGKGATFAEVQELVIKFDTDRGKQTNPDTLERRTYELIRLLHYYVGLGLKMENDIIIAYSDPKDAQRTNRFI